MKDEFSKNTHEVFTREVKKSRGRPKTLPREETKEKLTTTVVEEAIRDKNLIK